MPALVKTIADFNTTLALKVIVGDTTATLTSATDDDVVALPTGTYGFTIDRGNSSKEYITCTLTSTALTNIKTVTRASGAETTGFARAHRKGSEVIISDYVAIKSIQDVLESGYASAPTISTTNQLATKGYADALAIAGAPNATTTVQGLSELATQAEYDAGTATGATGASLSATPAILRGKKYNDHATDSVGSDAYAITITPAITAYATGQVFTFTAGTANTGACTLAVSGLAAKTIKKDVSLDLGTGDILANQIVTVVYDGTNMQLVSKTPSNSVTPIVTTYTANDTWTKASGLKYITVEVVGGGGGGGGANSTSSQSAAGGGGGGGGYSKKTIAAASLVSTETVTVGAAGAAGTTTTSGGAGGTSSFGSHASATGGGGGTYSNTNPANGGAGGAGSSGNVNAAGNGGGAGFGDTATVRQIMAGSGGGSVLGGGAQGVSSTTSANGGAGAAYGGGGAGGSSDNNNDATGGAGSVGAVIVTEFY